MMNNLEGGTYIFRFILPGTSVVRKIITSVVRKIII
jgi:hypothetical protein